MNISQEKIDNLNAILKINLNPEDYQPRVEKAMFAVLTIWWII